MRGLEIMQIFEALHVRTFVGLISQLLCSIIHRRVEFA